MDACSVHRYQPLYYWPREGTRSLPPPLGRADLYAYTATKLATTKMRAAHVAPFVFLSLILACPPPFM